MQQPPQGYTWKGIIDFLSYHQSLLKAREDQFEQEKIKFTMRIFQLEQEVVTLKVSNDQMSTRISELETKLGFDNNITQSRAVKIQPTQLVSSQNKQPNHQRVKSDQIPGLIGKSTEEAQSGNPMRRQRTGQHSGSQSISFHVAPGSKQLNLSSVMDTSQNKSLMHQFLHNVGCDEDNEEIVYENQQFDKNFQKFDNIMQQHDLTPNSNGSNNTANGLNSQNLAGIDPKQGQNRKKKSSGSQQSTIIYNQTTVNSINSNNYIQAFAGQQVQVNSSKLSNSFTNPLAGGGSSSSATAKQSQGGEQQQQPQQQQKLTPTNSTLPNAYSSNQSFIGSDIPSIMNSQPQKTSKQLKTNTNTVLTNNSLVNVNGYFPQNSLSSSKQLSNGDNTNKALPNNSFKLSCPSTPLNDSRTENQMITGKKIWNPKCTLRSHLDGVRGLFFTAVDPILVTAGEDCLLKLWDIRKFKENNENTFHQPYCTLRGHSGQIFALTGSQQQVDSTINYQCYNFMFSAGMEGIIKAWNIPLPEEIDFLGPTERKDKINVGQWRAHHDVIWDLNHHPFKPILLSSGSDGYIRSWKTFEPVDSTTLVSLSQGEMISQLTYKPDQFSDIPTSICWDLEHNQIISGWVSTNSLTNFDAETSSLIGTMNYTQENQTQSAQVNKVICHEGIHCAISGHEDKQIRFFDLKSNNLIKNLIGHTDAVTCISIHPNQFYMSSVGHDGSMRTWDIRNYKCIQDIQAHKTKFDESVHSVTYHPQLPLIATGGADGLVKIFHQQDGV